MDIPRIKKRIIFSGVMIIGLLLVFAINNVASEPQAVFRETKIHLARDILSNPILQKRDIWRVKQAAIFSDENDFSKNNILGSGSQSIEMFMENAYKILDKEPRLDRVSASTPQVREASVLNLDIKSTREMTLLKAANIKVSKHIVEPGETLWDISRLYGIDMETLVGANQGTSNLAKLKVGQELNILSSKGVIHRINSYETLSDISQLYSVSVKNIMDYNDMKSSRLKVGDTLIIPGAKLRDDLPFKNGFATDFIWPVHGRISSPFGMRWGRHHNGIDIAVNRGTPVLAAKSGKILYSGPASGYGLAVYIQHDDKTVTRYAHNDKLLVETNDYVYQGQRISLSGNTGVSTGPHLHFEIRLNNTPVNPLKYLD